MSPIYGQYLLDVHDELLVDLFAGGGGASVGIEMATGRQVDVAVNHDPAAVALHQANHPQTEHLTSDVFEVDPREVTGGRPVGLLWASPDCTYYSKARGGKPIRSKNRKRRALAWVVTRWAGQVRPRCIVLENVEEFLDWCPLRARRDRKSGRVRKAAGGVAGPGERTELEDQELVPDRGRRGRRFRRWVQSLERHGYEVEHRELRACDFGAPTTRKRLFVIARCDGEPIVWPEPTHGRETRRPYRSAASCIDWSEPMCSIFASPEEAKEWARAHGKHTPRRPLADATMRRIARGVMRFVVEAADPFVVSLAHGYSGGRREYPLDEPFGAQHSGGNKYAVVAPHLVPRYGEAPGQEPRVLDIQDPHPTVVPKGNGASLVATFLARHWGGMTGQEIERPYPTVTSRGTQDQIVAAHIQRDFGQSVGQGAGAPLGTVTPGGGGKAALVASFLQKYYSTATGSSAGEPAPTVTTKDRLGLVTCTVDGQSYVVVDIAMRMLQPRELYRAQGFPDSYVIDEAGERTLTKTEQVRMVGNSVSPPLAAALVRANVPELAARDEVRRAASW